MSVDYALDQYFSVSLSDDKVVAYIQFTKWDKDFSCSVEALEQFLRSHQIRYGIQYDTLRRIADHGEEYQYSRTPIAMGTEPTHGQNGKIQFTVDFGNETNLKPLEDEDGKVDFKEVLRLNNVKRVSCWLPESRQRRVCPEQRSPAKRFRASRERKRISRWGRTWWSTPRKRHVRCA